MSVHFLNFHHKTGLEFIYHQKSNHILLQYSVIIKEYADKMALKLRSVAADEGKVDIKM